MSRSGYSDDYDCDSNWPHIQWRGQVTSATRGKRGQAFLRDLRDALDAMPEKRLIAHELRQGGEVCAIGSLGAARGIDLEKLEVWDYDAIAAAFDIASPLVREIEWMNDEGSYRKDSPESRWCRMRAWVSAQIKQEPSP